MIAPRKRSVTVTEFFSAVCRRIETMTAEEKTEFRRAALENMLLKMKPATERIQ